MLLILAHMAHAAPIVNGEPEPGYEGVVSLGLPWAEDHLHVCTGTLITPRIVLSAAHCSAEADIEVVVTLGQAVFGPDVDDRDHTAKLADGAIHPDWDGVPEATESFKDEMHSDLAVVVLDEDAPFEPLFLRTALPDDTKQPLWAVGFGLDEAGVSGVKRSGEVEITQSSEWWLIGNTFQDANAPGICSGDSGGPAFFIDEQERPEQWGVSSWGDSLCRSQSGFTRADRYMDWILDQVEAEHGCRDLCAINGWFDDDRCGERDPDCAIAYPDDEQPVGGCACAGAPGAPGAIALVIAGLLAGLRRRVG